MFFEDKLNLCLKFFFANDFAEKLRELMRICKQNLFLTQKLQNKHNRKV